MILYSEQGYYPQTQFRLYKNKRTRSSTDYFNDLNNLLVDHNYDKESEQVFLLNEKRFHFFKFDIFDHYEKKFSVHDLNKIIEDKLMTIHHQTQGYRMLFYTTNTIFVNGEPSQYLFAKQGDIFFRLVLIFIDSQTMELFSRRWGNIFDMKQLSIYPKSYFTIQFLKKKLEKENFHLLTIQEESSMCLSIKDGFYENIASVNRGSSMLHSIYKDNGIESLFQVAKNDSTISHVAEQAINNSVSFFTKMLAKRLGEHLGVGKDIILISDLNNNDFFSASFSSRYTDLLQANVLPFHYSNTLETFNKKWQSDDLDALTTINKSSI